MVFLDILDKFSEMSINKWNDSPQENNKEYSKLWYDLDVELLKNYISGNIEFLPDDINWIYPKKLFKEVEGKKVLCLASGGGQQSVVFSLLGADVTVCDISISQLELDKKAASHYGYKIKIINSDMRDLRLLDSNSFDIVYQPVSICFVPDIIKVYLEVYRVLRNNGIYSVSHCNPSTYPVWFYGEKNGWDGIGYRITEPYVCGEIRIDENGNENMTKGNGIGEFRHSLSDIFNKLIEIGFIIEGVFEDPRTMKVNKKVDDIHSIILSYFSILGRKKI